MEANNRTCHVGFNLRREEASSCPAILQNESDTYILSAPLRKSNAKVEVGSRVIHDGVVRPGMLRLIYPGDRNRVSVRAPAEVMLLSLPGRLFREIVSDAAPEGVSSDPAYVEPLLKSNIQAATLSTALLSFLEVDCRHRQLFIDGMARSLLALLLSSQESARGGELLPKSGLTDAQLARCLDFADSRISERLDLDSWASTLDMTTSEFARRFQQRTHLPPYAWFMNWRIDRAKQLLSQARLSVVEVAMEVGFCSQSHFTEAFRRRVGMAPGRWRSRAQGRDGGEQRNVDIQRNHESQANSSPVL